MRLFVINKKNVLSLMIIILLLILVIIIESILFDSDDLIMGGNYSNQVFLQYSCDEVSNEITSDTEYFRPSDFPILNNREFESDFFHQYDSKETSKIILPSYLLKTPEDTILNYYSVLRHAANHEEGKMTGCGTLGYAKIPYPIAYSFLSPEYQSKLSYKEYIDSFENILHLNLIKLEEVEKDEQYPNMLRYFVELETIEGSDKGIGYFGYYYGYVYLINEEGNYKISNTELKGEDYLCAPYHGWDYIAEAVIDIKYGEWCSLVKERYETQQDGYVKKIFFKGTDGDDYLIKFFQLTNGKDIEISQYKKQENEWEIIKLNPEDCLDIKR